MTNLLKETIATLENNNKSEEDVVAVISSTCKITWLMFKKRSDFNYNNGYGINEIPQDLKIVGEGFWLERGEYDGSEWWEFKCMPSLDLPYSINEVEMLKMIGKI